MAISCGFHKSQIKPITNPKENFQPKSKQNVCILYVGQMRENTVLTTDNHIEWLTKQFPEDKYNVDIFFVTDELNLEQIKDNKYFSKRVKNVLMDYNNKKQPYIFDSSYITEKIYQEISHKLSKSYIESLRIKIRDTLLQKYPHVYGKETDHTNSVYNHHDINFMQYLKLQIGIQLKLLHEKHNNFKYDIVFKLRPDITFVEHLMLDPMVTSKFYISHDLMFGSFNGEMFDKLYSFVDEYGSIDLQPLFGHKQFDPNTYVKNDSLIMNQRRWYKAPEIRLIAMLCKITNMRFLEHAIINYHKDMGKLFVDLSRHSK